MDFRDESRMNTIMFSKDWKKLDSEVFTTIRSSNNKKFQMAEEGERWLAHTPTRKFPAILLYNISSQIFELPTTLLTYDTDTKTRTEALQEINSFYKYPLTQVQLLLFKKV